LIARKIMKITIDIEATAQEMREFFGEVPILTQAASDLAK
jgi:hypothetical protein